MSNPNQAASKASPPSLNKATKEGVVVVEIGTGPVRHHVHKALLQYHSEYFRGVFNGPWKEAKEGVVRLSDIEPSVFSLFVHWLYSQQLPPILKDWEYVLDMEFSSLFHYYSIRYAVCIKAYIFGDRFIAPGFRRAAHNMFATDFQRNNMWYYSRVPSITLAFANIPSNRVILQLIADNYRLRWETDELPLWVFTPTEQARLPGALLTRIMRSYREVGKGTKAEETALFQSRCYLEHQDEEEKGKCSKKHMIYNAEADCAYFH
ncbi:hypothetical protein FB567DRAFT_600176 [Paraphoma chrysanthemicola]|uniref:BTB domain-containing protein n=1 Tax=Paraphoma chrysanthemicola TaxID=798071 RepID=A0A8K0REH8_9PLEO|nr:hypothetical protein FB567DRAFT_600176 [Paraphoma chrysanthemicola]